nr:hypothetical protein [Olsenella massiliensis]
MGHRRLAGWLYALKLSHRIEEDIDLPCVFRRDGKKLRPAPFKVPGKRQGSAFGLQGIEGWFVVKVNIGGQHAQLAPELVQGVFFVASDKPMYAVVDMIALAIPACALTADHLVLFED